MLGTLQGPMTLRNLRLWDNKPCSGASVKLRDCLELAMKISDWRLKSKLMNSSLELRTHQICGLPMEAFTPAPTLQIVPEQTLTWMLTQCNKLRSRERYQCSVTTACFCRRVLCSSIEALLYIAWPASYLKVSSRPETLLHPYKRQIKCHKDSSLIKTARCYF